MNDALSDRILPSSRRPWLYLAASVYFLLVVWLNNLQIRALAFAKGVDQTYLFESLWNTVHGHFFVHTHAITNLGGWGLMDHFWPSMLLMVPIVAVFQNILSLYVINALCLTATGLVFARMARRYFESETIGFLAAVVFWTMPESFAFAFTGNWPEIWAMPFFALMFLFYLEDRPLPFSLSAVAFMGCMEHLLVYVVIFATIEVVGKRRRRWMVLPVTLGILYAAVTLLASSGSSSGRFFTHTFALTGSRILGFLTILLFEWGRSPLLYLSLLWPRALIFAMPPALIVTAWNLDIGLLPINDGALRYAFFIFFPMAVGGLCGLRPFSKKLGQWFNIQALRIAGGFLVMALVIHAAVLITMWPNEKHRFRQSPSDELTWEIIESLPATARVVTNREIPFAFFGRVDTFVSFFNVPFFSIQEFYFDDRNRPVPPWTGVEKYHAMGRHTPSAIVLENIGGEMRPATALWAPRHFPYHLVDCADTNNDGRLDILMWSPGSSTIVFQNHQDAALSFESPRPQDETETVEPQLALSLGNGQTLTISEDRRHILVKSGLALQSLVQNILIDGYLEEVAAVDLDGDGLDEILAVDSQRYLIRIFRLRENGSWNQLRTIPAPPIPTSISSADLDADGDLDLVVTKSQRPPDVEAFARLIDHEGIDHILWFDNPLQEDLRIRFQALGWKSREVDGLLYLSRPKGDPRMHQHEANNGGSTG